MNLGGVTGGGDPFRYLGGDDGGMTHLMMQPAPPVEMAGVEPVMGPVPTPCEHTEAIRAEFG